jgi:transposase
MEEPEPRNHSMKTELLYLGLDVHSQSIAIALAESGGEVRHYGSISGDLHALEKALTKIKKAHPGCKLKVCYEAGPTGFVIARRLAQLKTDCLVAAPSLIPTRSGDRVKTDPRDAAKLARLLRAGELTAVHVPSSKHSSCVTVTATAARARGAKRTCAICANWCCPMPPSGWCWRTRCGSLAWPPIASPDSKRR